MKRMLVLLNHKLDAEQLEALAVLGYEPEYMTNEEAATWKQVNVDTLEHDVKAILNNHQFDSCLVQGHFGAVGVVLKSEDTIRESLGDKLKDYKIYTDINWCGATITYISMFERLLNTKGTDTAFAFQDMLKEWSYAVNLWDTFQWKNIPELPEDKKTLGRKMGTVDKIADSEKELYRGLDAILTLRKTLDHYFRSRMEICFYD